MVIAREYREYRAGNNRLESSFVEFTVKSREWGVQTIPYYLPDWTSKRHSSLSGSKGKGLVPWLMDQRHTIVPLLAAPLRLTPLRD